MATYYKVPEAIFAIPSGCARQTIAQAGKAAQPAPVPNRQAGLL